MSDLSKFNLLKHLLNVSAISTHKDNFSPSSCVYKTVRKRRNNNLARCVYTYVKTKNLRFSISHMANHLALSGTKILRSRFIKKKTLSLMLESVNSCK